MTGSYPRQAPVSGLASIAFEPSHAGTTNTLATVVAAIRHRSQTVAAASRTCNWAALFARARRGRRSVWTTAVSTLRTVHSLPFIHLFRFVCVELKCIKKQAQWFFSLYIKCVYRGVYYFKTFIHNNLKFTNIDLNKSSIALRLDRALPNNNSSWVQQLFIVVSMSICNLKGEHTEQGITLYLQFVSTVSTYKVQ